VADTAPLQTALAGTDAAVYAYGLVGAALPTAERSDALDAMAEVRELRDRLRELLTATGAVPTGAAPAYEPPFPVTGTAAARRLAGLVEDRLAGQLAAVAAALTGADRGWAADAAQSCGRRSTGWTGLAPVWFGHL
jgi:hypothetical protein